MGLDVVSGGELFVAHKAGFPLHRVYFHGNNKGADELAMALDLGVGRIVVDNLHEMAMLNQLAVQRKASACRSCFASLPASTPTPTPPSAPASSTASSASSSPPGRPRQPWCRPWPHRAWRSWASTPTSAP